jgi:hypothetical protein
MEIFAGGKGTQSEELEKASFRKIPRWRHQFSQTISIANESGLTFIVPLRFSGRFWERKNERPKPA